ncbi:Nudix family hydrolase [Entomomonas asaccharolytica]|uniref:8-oxo-dGTP diphosphatase n=1 Tax=Entomomonas asaccharolytica TaxID=2785331 RepID=A0A974NDN5_9GAMM|nr:Nudix family hydrolase [Entomomonas asaccharolytica]QQP84763.1 Nudix family hydrolase [Entomomonas asaccharolytica]
MEQIKVVAAIIRQNGRVLLARRAKHKHQGGLWEFPGGKIEAGESAEQALKRELKEELAIEVTKLNPVFQTSHQYPEYGVHLDIWEVTAFEGEAGGAEGQEVIWVQPKNLLQYDFPAANKAIITAARLSNRYLITPENLDRAEIIEGIRIALDEGIKLICLRAPHFFDPDYRDLAIDAVGVCAGRADLLVKGAFEWLGDFPSAGWHVTAEQLRKLADKGRPLPANRWLAASCHNEQELALAKKMGVDFVTLSPVQKTATHPDVEPLGWERAKQLIADFDRPVFVLGGLTGQDVPTAQQAGAQGVAAIRGLWPYELD